MQKRVFWIYFIWLLVAGNVFSQNQNTSPREVMRAYHDKNFTNPSDPIVLTASDTLLDMAYKYNDTTMIKLALGAKLDYYYYGSGDDRTDSIVAWVNRIKDFAVKVKNDELYYWVWTARLVNHYIKLGEYNIALAETERMLKEAEDKGLKGGLAEGYFSLANIYSAKGLPGKAQEFMLKEIELFERYKLARYHITFQYSDAARIYIDQGEPGKAGELLKKAVEQSKSPYHLVTAKLVYVPLYLAENNIPAARKALEECRKMFVDNPGLRRHIHYLQDVEVEFYRQTGEYNEAMRTLALREKELVDDNNLVDLSALRKVKADVLWEMNRKEEAGALYREYLEEQKKEKEKNEEITASEFATLLNIQKLNAEKRELEKIAQARQLQNTRTILFLITGILCLVIIFLYKQRSLNRKLKRSRDKLDEKNRILLKAEEELRKAKELAEQSSWMKTVFIQNMSHEIRTPLNSIVGFSTVLADLLSDHEDVKQFTSLIEENSQLLLKLLGDILDISVLDNNEEIKRSLTEVNGCCLTAIERARYYMHKGVEMEFLPACGELMVNSNAGRLTQVLENLLNNAAKFTSEGKITLSYDIDEKKQQVVFTVTDTGIGIPVDQQERVFERFVKLDDFTQGTGLGLSISLIIVEKLGGYLMIDKEYAHGSRFVFSVAM